MELGIGTYTHAWAFGVPGHLPQKPMCAEDLIKRAKVINSRISAFRDAGVLLAIENHDRFKCSELVEIINTTDPQVVGICLDTVNSFGAGEGVQEVLDQLMPHTLNFHIKDFSIRRKSHQMGFEIIGTPAGNGFLNIPQIVENLRKFGKCFSCTLELWTPPEEKLEDTITKETLWSEQSLAYLKQNGIFGKSSDADYGK